MKKFHIFLQLVLVFFLSFSGIVNANDNTEQVIGYHLIKTDSEGKVVPWKNGNPSISYDDIIQMHWKFWDNMNHLVWRNDFNDERGNGRITK